MINKKIILVLMLAIFMASCKKTYQCQCTNSNGTYNAGEITDTKRKAKKQCEKLTSGGTTCTIS